MRSSEISSSLPRFDITTSNRITKRSTRPRGVPALLAVSFFYWMSQYIYVPTLPEYIRRHAVSLVAVGVILSMYGLWQAIIRIPLGVAVDKTGRGKAFLVLGFLFSAAGALVLAHGRSSGAFLLGRSLSGVAAGTWVPLVVVFTALFPSKRAVVAASLLTFSGSFGRLIATSLTGWLNGIGGYSLPFYLSVAAAVACIVVVMTVKIERRGDIQSISARSILAIFRRGAVVLPSIMSALLQFGAWVVTFAFMPILASRIGAGEVTLSFLVGVNVVADMSGNLLTARAARRAPRAPLLYSGLFLFAAGIGVYALTGSVGWFFAASFLMGIGNGLSYPTLMALSIERVTPSHRTTAMGIHQSVYSLGMFAGPWLGGMLAGPLGIRLTFGITAALCLLAGGPLIFLRMRMERFPGSGGGLARQVPKRGASA